MAAAENAADMQCRPYMMGASMPGEAAGSNSCPTTAVHVLPAQQYFGYQQQQQQQEGHSGRW
jgi:hypothetical protein